MPILNAAKKAIRQDKVRRARNLSHKRAYKRILKEARILIAEGKQKEAEALLPKIYKTLDKSAKRNIIKKNTASRYKSRFTKAIAGVTRS